MRHFKLPLIVTVIAVVLAALVGLGGVTMIHRSKISDRQKMERAKTLGTGVAVTTCVIIWPFWIIAAGKVGKARREAREQARAQQANREG